MEAVAGGEPKARLRREVIVKSSEDVNVMPLATRSGQWSDRAGAWTGHKSQPQPE